MTRLALPLILPVLGLAGADAGAVTPEERSFLIAHFEDTRRALLGELEAVTEAQWRFKPAPERWSIAEVMEHLVLAEDFLAGFYRQALDQPPGQRLPSSNPATDKLIATAFVDRTRKFQAPAPATPSGQWRDPAAARAEFLERRARNLETARSTTAPLRLHAFEGPTGKMDAYQGLLMIAAHSARHIAQIREIKAAEGFPRK